VSELSHLKGDVGRACPFLVLLPHPSGNVTKSAQIAASNEVPRKMAARRIANIGYNFLGQFKLINIFIVPAD
jgi:hypothetical protein